MKKGDKGEKAETFSSVGSRIVTSHWSKAVSERIEVVTENPSKRSMMRKSTPITGGKTQRYA